MESTPVVISEQRGSVTGQVFYRYRTSDGTIQWTATLTGAFTYNGSTATCTAASCETSVQTETVHLTLTCDGSGNLS